MSGLPARAQRVSRARFNFSGKAPCEASVSQPLASQPSTSQPLASQPLASQPLASQPLASQSVGNQSVGSQPTRIQETRPARPADCVGTGESEPATKVRKLSELNGQPVSVASAATPVRNSKLLPDESDWSGVTVVFTSDLTSIDQAAAEKQVVAAGGKVGSAISQRTSLLVLGGSLPDGRPSTESAKYQRFLELQSKGKVHAKVLSEQAFLTLLPATNARTTKHLPLEKQEVPADSHKKQQIKDVKCSQTRNWVDIFSPRKLEDLLGNQGAIRRLAEWLQDWDDVVLHGKSKKLAFRRGSVPDNVNVTRPSCSVGVFFAVQLASRPAILEARAVLAGDTACGQDMQDSSWDCVAAMLAG